MFYISDVGKLITNRITFLFVGTLLMPLISTYVSAAENKIYSGCGSSQQEARKELAKNLHSYVKSSFEKEVTESKTSLIDYFTQKTTVKDSQSTQISLCNVSIEKNNGEVCASVSQTELKDCAQNMLESQQSFLVSNLPTTEKARLKKAREWLNDIVYADTLYTVVGKNKFDQKKMRNIVKIENSLLKVLDNQYVRFDIRGASVNILVGSNKKVSAGKDTALKVGTHAYKITSPGHCEITGNVTLTEKGVSRISYDMTDYTLPEITFVSRPPNAQLTVGGKNTRVGSRITEQRCDGVLPYSFTLQGVTKDGDVTLKPGLKTTVKEKFTPPDVIDTAKGYRKGKIWKIQLENILPNFRNNNIDKLSGIKVSRQTMKDNFRWGYNAVYATDQENSHAVEMTGEFSLQFLDYNLGREALYFGPFVFIPSVGIELGLGYHDFNGVRSFEDIDASEWKKIYQSYVVLRPMIGFDAAINKDINFTFNYSRSIYMNESDVMSIGMGFRF